MVPFQEGTGALPASLQGLLIFVVVAILALLAWIVKQGFTKGIDALNGLKGSVDNAGTKVVELKTAIEFDSAERKRLLEKADAQRSLDLQSEDLKRENAVREVLRVQAEQHLAHSSAHATFDAKLAEVAKDVKRIADVVEKRTPA